MAKINGVLGPIDTAELGFTLMHEHVLVANHSMRKAFSDWIDCAERVAFAVGEIEAARERGVRTIVDLTPINLGRDIRVIGEVAEKSGIQMIAATGFYWHEEPWFVGWEADRLVEWLLRDIERGIEGTNVKAGIIKCATDVHGVTELNRKLLTVAARLHRASGVPISTHTSVHNRSGLAQQEVFGAEGVDLSRVVIGHCGDSDDLEYLEAILARGSFIGMDRFGLNQLLSFEKRVETVAALCRKGYSSRMVLSHDACCGIDWFPGMDFSKVMPQWNFRHLCDDVLPALRKAGVSDAQILEMTVANPRRIFERQGAY